jgi:hypothetical protein
MADSAIRIFPNPSGKFVNVIFPNGKECDVSVMDSNGKSIFEKISVMNSCFINTEDWEAGIYFIKITGDMNIIEKLVLD